MGNVDNLLLDYIEATIEDEITELEELDDPTLRRVEAGELRKLLKDYKKAVIASADQLQAEQGEH